jgi:GNAT superfamily N-acetyltransferase
MPRPEVTRDAQTDHDAERTVGVEDPMTSVVIRRIRPHEGMLLRELRLRALEDSPDAFGQRVPEALGVAEAEWRTTARASADGKGRAWFLAEGPDGVLGMVQGRRRPLDTLLIFSMWVDPAARRLGLGRGLIEAAEAWARTWNGRRTVLWVLYGNDLAKRFYERLGFSVVPHGPDAEVGARHGSFAMWRAIPAPDPGQDVGP